jgi:osmoprotectant transport system permease protein
MQNKLRIFRLRIADCGLRIEMAAHNQAMKSIMVKWLLLGICVVVGWSHAEPACAQSVTVGAKNFPEGRLLSEIMATLIEANTSLKVTRKFGLGGTNICFNALQAGEIDMYPEYTGTALVDILKEPALHDPEQTYQRVKTAFAERYQLIWLKPFGFNNTYALAIRAEDAEAMKIFRISDLRKAPGLRAAFTREFLQREDGYPGLSRYYGLHLENIRGLEHGLAYKAVREKQVDIVDAYSTDGKIDAYHLRILEDDKNFFPPYYAAPVLRAATAAKHTEVVALLNKLGGTIDDARMRQLNLQVEQGEKSFERVAQEFLQSLGLLGGKSIQAPQFQAQSFVGLLWQQRHETVQRSARHLQLTFLSVALAVFIGLPIGIGISRRPRLAAPILGFMGVIQTIPSIALLGFMLPFLGIGAKPALAALFLYALLPIIQNTYTGIRGVDALLIEAGQGIGMTPRQILFIIELPLAFSVIMAGIRTSTVINIGTATLAAFIGAGGLGEPIVTGLSLNDNNMILTGAVPAALLAIAADLGLARLERWAAPKGLRNETADERR